MLFEINTLRDVMHLQLAEKKIINYMSYSETTKKYLSIYDTHLFKSSCKSFRRRNP